jgi:hypothetical protein
LKHCGTNEALEAGLNCYQIICQRVGAFEKILNLTPHALKKPSLEDFCINFFVRIVASKKGSLKILKNTKKNQDHG